MARKLSGQITVTTAGTAVQGSNEGKGTYILSAPQSNTGDYVYVGNDGANDVSSTTGMILKKGESVAVKLNNLSDCWFDAGTNGDKVCWFKFDEASQ